jgi:hypothetical protein
MGEPARRQDSYRFMIGDKEFESPHRTITGEEIRQIAGISTKLRIFLRDHHRGEADQEITHTCTVDLAAPGEKSFYTLPHPTMDIY